MTRLQVASPVPPLTRMVLLRDYIPGADACQPLRVMQATGRRTQWTRCCPDPHLLSHRMLRSGNAEVLMRGRRRQSDANRPERMFKVGMPVEMIQRVERLERRLPFCVEKLYDTDSQSWTRDILARGFGAR
jgi:hypothetical protein